MTEVRRTRSPNIGRPITIAILAMGGEGGGVLADWLVELAKHSGYASQMTSVPGVAQRTGATIYYIEMFQVPAGQTDRAPVFALMPGPGDVDIVIASELMEAGRAVQRGLVTPTRTTLIASTHRVYSMTEKTAMGDGRVDSAQLLQAIEAAAQRLVRADFAKMASEHATVISAPLLGALAGSGVLPFARAAFEETITASGVGVKASLSAFAAAFAAAQVGASPEAGTPVAKPAGVAIADPFMRLGPRLKHLESRIRTNFGPAAHSNIVHGVIRLADYQDIAYAEEFLQRLERIAILDRQQPGAELLTETARHLALWMSYEDTIRVADLKTRQSRFSRVAGEQDVQGHQMLEIREFLHPRVEEIADTLPVPLGRALLARPALKRFVERFTHKGRVVHTNSIRGFLLLYSVASLRRWRRSSLRYSVEHAHIATWLQTIESLAGSNYPLALEFAKLQRLVKGYGDTHLRGMKNYQRIFASLPSLRQADDAVERLKKLTEAALSDESGSKLSALLETV